MVVGEVLPRASKGPESVRLFWPGRGSSAGGGGRTSCSPSARSSNNIDQRPPLPYMAWRHAYAQLLGTDEPDGLLAIY